MQRVSLWIRINTADGSRRYVKPHLKKLRATATGEVHPEGVYALRYQEDGRRRWKEVGNELAFLNRAIQ